MDTRTQLVVIAALSHRRWVRVPAITSHVTVSFPRENERPAGLAPLTENSSSTRNMRRHAASKTPITQTAAGWN